MNPLLTNIWICAFMCALTWVLSLITREHSWVDRIWSIIPVVYVWVFAGAAGLSDGRLNLIAALVTLWGIRLTFNFARKGGYKPGGEDYRWQKLRSGMRPWQFQIFNFFFIVIYQNALLLLITCPVWTAYTHQSPLNGLDLLAAIAFLAFLAGETVADQQQWNFHQRKASLIAAGGTPNPRFLQSGLFRFSRHPNFFFEQAQWWVVFFFGTIAAGSLVQWTIIGPILLLAVFIGSTKFTEAISLSRYPEYAEYQARTSPVIPWFPRNEGRQVATGER